MKKVQIRLIVIGNSTFPSLQCSARFGLAFSRPLHSLTIQYNVLYFERVDIHD